MFHVNPGSVADRLRLLVHGVVWRGWCNLPAGGWGVLGAVGGDAGAAGLPAGHAGVPGRPGLLDGRRAALQRGHHANPALPGAGSGRERPVSAVAQLCFSHFHGGQVWLSGFAWFYKHDSIPWVYRNEIGLLLKETGLSALLTSLNNILAFLTGAILPIPALRIFCLQVSVFLNIFLRQAFGSTIEILSSKIKFFQALLGFLINFNKTPWICKTSMKFIFKFYDFLGWLDDLKKFGQVHKIKSYSSGFSPKKPAPA